MNKAFCWYRSHPYLSEFYPSKILKLISDPGIFEKYFSSNFEITMVRKYFPNGLNPHGFSRLALYKTCDDDFNEPLTEIIFELVRQLYFPDAPSRLTSLYASESIEQAMIWQKLWKNNFKDNNEQLAHSLWEIEYESNAKLFDANHLNIFSNDEFSYITALDYANKYWQGHFSENPLPELLIPYPVTIVRIIPDTISFR